MAGIGPMYGVSQMMGDSPTGPSFAPLLDHSPQKFSPMSGSPRFSPLNQTTLPGVHPDSRRGPLAGLCSLPFAPSTLCFCGLVTLAFILVVCALAIPEWIVGDIHHVVRTVGDDDRNFTINRRIGLFQVCGKATTDGPSDECFPISEMLEQECRDVGATFDFFMAMGIVAAVALVLIFLPLPVLLCWVEHWMVPSCCILVLLGLAALPLLTWTIGLPIVLEETYTCEGENAVGVKAARQLCPGCYLGTSYYLGLCATLLVWLGLVTACCASCHRWFRMDQHRGQEQQSSGMGPYGPYRRMHQPASPGYSPAPSLSPVPRPTSPATPTTPYRRFSPTPTAIGEHRFTPVDEELLARCEMVKDRLSKTLCDDAARSYRMSTPSPLFM